MIEKVLRRVLSVSLLAVCLISSAMAQQDVQQETDENSNVTYSANYFAEFNPLTVNDMLDRVPGIDLILEQGFNSSSFGGGNRGLGSSAQILIDGKRLAGKANEARSQLDRISADQVESIEIVRGTSSDLDVQNSGQLVNIILRSAQTRSSLTTELNATHFFDGEIEPGGSIAWTGQSGRLSYLVSGGLRTGYRHTENIETSFNGDLSPNDTRDEDRYSDQQTYSFNSNLAYALSNGDRIAFNLLYNDSDPPQSLFRTTTDFNAATPIVSYVRESTSATSEDWEFGGDYEHGFENGNRFKFLFIVNEKERTATRERYASTLLGGTESKNLFLDTTSRNQEKIGRGSYTLNLSASQGLEVGLEAAQTTQDSGLRLGLPSGGEGSPNFGGLSPIPFPNAFSTVEEVRYEPFAIHNWQINERMSLESSLVAEYSEIEQKGDVNNKRDFDFIKPKLDYRFDVSTSVQFNASLEKVVSQLSFADFSRATNDSDDDQDTIAGNPELVPEESLRLEAGVDLRLPNDGGAINLRAFYYDFDNKIGRVDASTVITDPQSTNGNVGPAKSYGLASNLSLRLGFLGMPTALLTAALTVQESSIKNDLFPTENDLRFPPYDRGGFRIGFRQDVSALALSYGLNYNSRINGNRTLHDINNRAELVFPSNLSVFVERVWFGGLSYRFEGRNLEDFEGCGERRRFNGYLRDGILQEIEFPCSRSGMQFVLKIRGTF
ncbi:MAG: TonB-dependent receptor plug domain-containing protein [Gammaproteobacteria bacterium]|nr:TonB-dependent receptor plug domain-containing protein [Gammaproteobacteria bacterium]